MVQKGHLKIYGHMYIYSTNVNMYMCIVLFSDQHKRKIPKPQDPEGAWPTSMPWSWAMGLFSLMTSAGFPSAGGTGTRFASGAPEGPPWLICPNLQRKNNRKFQVARLQTQAQPNPALTLVASGSLHSAGTQKDRLKTPPL